MLTKEERATIAERLRYVDYIYDGTLYRALFGCDAPNDASFEEDSKAILERLADLIDPTCEVVEVPDNDEFMVRVVSGFMCKKCGHEAIVERNCDGWAEPPNYCPHCGARVVR